ncbi:MAG TPA: hypothetical protein VGD66_13165 [Allosphingosinicella sp.]
MAIGSAAGALLLAAPVLAHEQHAGDGGKTVERVIILSGPGHHGDSAVERRVRVVELGGPEGASCGGGTPTEVNSASPDGREKTRIVICGHDGVSAAERADKLEKALTRIQQNDELSAEHKARVTAALQEAIERLRNSR